MPTLLKPDFSRFLTLYDVQFEYREQDYIPYAVLLNTWQWQEKRYQMFEQYDFRCQSCGTQKNLQLHHNYYIQGRLPWDYSDEGFTPLCGECHWKFHCTNEVMVYLEMEDELVAQQNLVQCHRCHGAGHFPEFNHIDNGICFRCRGERYENFIHV